MILSIMKMGLKGFVFTAALLITCVQCLRMDGGASGQNPYHLDNDNYQRVEET